MTSQEHVDVGAYVLGVLDDAEASRFEAHLQYCQVCAREYESLAELTPILAEFARSAPDVESLVAKPSERLLDNLLGEVAAKRRQSRRRRLYLVAAAVALIIAGPVVGTVVASGGDPATNPSQSVIAGRQLSGVDPDTKVDATVGLQDKQWGTKVGLRLSNVKGPLKCDLVAISVTGEEQVITTWAVPELGYGINGRPPLEISGGAAMKSGEIDRLEVRTLKGDRLVTVPVRAGSV